MPVTAVLPEKIKEKSYLLYKVQQKHHRLNTPRSTLLIGAGCSYPILPLGGGVVKICQQLCFVRHADPLNAARIIEEFLKSGDLASLEQSAISKREDKFNDYVKAREKALLDRLREMKVLEIKKLPPDVKWDDFEKCILSDASYGYWMDEYNASPKERQRLIEALIENKNPGGAYIILAFLIEMGFFSNILTSNFDDFINDALLNYTGTKPRFYADDELSQYISIYSAKPNIIKLHGDYRYANIKNTADETNNLSRRLESKLRELLTELDIIVIGYNGADFSIMNVLQQVKSPDCELLWCGLDEQNVHWRVAHLINNTANSYFIKIKGFDDLIGDFYLEFLKKPPENLVEVAKKRQTEIGEYVKQFSRELIDKAETTEEKERLKQREEIWELWIEADKKNDYNQQVDLLTKILSLDDNSVLAFNNRGYALNNLGDYQHAVNDFDRATDLDKSYVAAYGNRAESYYHLVQYERAIEDYSRAIELNKMDPVYFSGRGSAYTQLKQHEKAIDDHNQAIALDDKSAVSFDNRGCTYLSIKDYALAESDLTQAIELETTYPNCHKHRGDCYFQQKKYDASLRDLNRAIELDPKYKEAYRLRAQVYDVLGEQEKADADRKMADELTAGKKKQQ
jgi:tetratricopeptide (TPR) repeat protein